VCNAPQLGFRDLDRTDPLFANYPFPRAIPEPAFIQPDYARWAAIHTGMSRTQVIDILGPPLEESFHGREEAATATPLLYGYLSTPMLPHEYTYSFSIYFDESGKVWSKVDPFNGRFSDDSLPVAPEIITPHEGATFFHFPRILDLRWYPSSGEYPISYAVELGYARVGSRSYYDQGLVRDLASPFFIAEFVGACLGRFRVRAANRFGCSRWSEYRCFEFTR